MRTRAEAPTAERVCVIGHSVRQVGDNGRAQLMKLAVDLSLAAQMLAFSEGVVLAERAGLERELLDDLAGSGVAVR